MDEQAKGEFRELIHRLHITEAETLRTMLQQAAQSKGLEPVLEQAQERTQALGPENISEYTAWLDGLDPVGQLLALKTIRLEGKLADFCHEWAPDWFRAWSRAYTDITFGSVTTDEPGREVSLNPT